MSFDPNKAKQIAEAYTAAWNSESAEAVAEFYAMDGRIVINRGEPWEGRARVAETAADFFADVPDLKLVCDELRCAGDHVVHIVPCKGVSMLERRISAPGRTRDRLRALIEGKSGSGAERSALVQRDVPL